MSERKNIDRLFQEKFKDFESEPSEMVWDRIQAELHSEREKKRAIPLWVKLGGIAAALLVGVIITELVTIPFLNKKNSVVEEDKRKEGIDDNTELSIPVNTPFKTNQEIITKNEKEDVRSDKEDQLKPVSLQQIIANTFSSVQNKKDKQNTSLESYTVDKIVLGEKNKRNQQGNTSLWLDEKISSEFRKDQNRIGDTTISDKNTSEDESAIVVTAKDRNVLEELLKKIENKEAEKELITEIKKDKWQITTNVAPVYFNSTSGGSSIDPQFADNTKSSETNVSYGVGINYALNDKWSLRTGVNKVTLGYNTKEVAFYPELSNYGRYSSGMQNVNPSGAAANIVLQNEADKAMAGLNDVNSTIQGTHEGSVNQKIGYIEVPLEVSYKIVDKKFGMQLIGGVSTFFLNENKVSLISSGVRSHLGEANNLNDLHFSSNIGLGFKYSFLKAFEANFEPMFKYQFNTFSNNVGDFKPYFIGLYTGVSFTF